MHGSGSRDLFLVASFAALVLACGGGGGSDGGPAGDAQRDAGPEDAGGAVDTGAEDAASPNAGWDAGLRGSWSCLGPALAWPPPLFTPVTLSLTFWDLENGDVVAPFHGAAVTACPGEPTCAAPIGTATTGADGMVVLSVPTTGGGFRGFFRVRSATTATTYLHLLPPVWFNGARWRGPWALGSWSDLEAMARGSGVTLDRAKGVLLVLTADCCYLVSGPVAGCGTSDTDELDVTAGGRAAQAPTSGYARLFYNLDPGPTAIVATLRATGQVVGRNTVHVVAGAFTETVLGPTPP